jgi:hypothetical protein
MAILCQPIGKMDELVDKLEKFRWVCHLRTVNALR